MPVPALGILVDMPEVHAGRGIDFCPRIITPARSISLRSNSRKHNPFSLRKVAWGIAGETSGVPNRREDCRVGSGITYDRVSILINGYAGPPAPQTVATIGPILLLHRSRREIAAGNVELIPANGSRPVGEIQHCGLVRPQRFRPIAVLINNRRHDLIAHGIQFYRRSLL